MKINKQQINITLNKTELSAIIAEALTDETANASIKRILNPFLANSFPQFPDFTSVSLGETAEDGSTLLVLKQPAIRAKSEVTTIDPAIEETLTSDQAESEPVFED